MVNLIGLLDYDAVFKKQYVAPNYDIGVTYADLKKDKNNNVRLILSLSQNNLSQYSRILVFKNSKILPHPSTLIENYYSYNVEEFGPGFAEKPLRPNVIETRYLIPDFSCYNNIILLSINKPYNILSWKIHRKAVGKNYQHVRLFELIYGEMCKKDFPKERKILVYDNPVDILNNPDQLAYFEELLAQKKVIKFTQRIDISSIKDTNIIERIIFETKFRKYLMELEASDLSKNIEWVVSLLQQRPKKLVTQIKFKPVDKADYSFENLMLIHSYNAATDYKLWIKPMDRFAYQCENKFARFLYTYLQKTPYLTSFYEYVANKGFIKNGVPLENIRADEDIFISLEEQYGRNELLWELEKIMLHNPQYEKYILIGGKSNYEKFRRKFYDVRAGEYAFTTSSYGTGSICSLSK